MKKVFLVGILLGASFVLVNCGSSSSGGQTAAVTPLCDPDYGCLAQASCVDAQSCLDISGINPSQISCHEGCGRRGDVRVGPGSCLPQNSCGFCSADDHGHCVPGIATIEDSVGHARYTEGHPAWSNGHVVMVFDKFHRRPVPKKAPHRSPHHH